MNRQLPQTWLLCATLLIPSAAVAVDYQAKEQQQAPPTTLLQDWGKTLAIRSSVQNDVVMCMWFYEWQMFDAVVPRQHSLCPTVYPWKVHTDGKQAILQPPGMQLTVKAVPDGALMLLKITNQSDHDWPELASLVPCFTPGSIRGPKANVRFIDDEFARTYFMSKRGLTRLVDRDAHFHRDVRARLDAERRKRAFDWTAKWPLSSANTSGDLMVREGTQGHWVTGIAWERSLASQGHNPWKCMHLAVRVGPLKRGDTRTIRGRIYLFEGTKEECLKKYEKEFVLPQQKPATPVNS